jgi:hypothetical protein
MTEIVVPNHKAYERLLPEKLLTLPKIGDNFACRELGGSTRQAQIG